MSRGIACKCYGGISVEITTIAHRRDVAEAVGVAVMAGKVVLISGLSASGSRVLLQVNGKGVQGSGT